MRSRVLVFLAAVFLVTLTGQNHRAAAASHPVETSRVNGREYVSSRQWGAGRGLSARWIKRDDTLELRGNSGVVVLKGDSREAEVNHVSVWLSHPVARSGGDLLIARSDCTTTVEPLLLGMKRQTGARIASICLDPGHGGKDPGNQVGSYQEKKYTLALAQELKSQLTRAGFKVMMTRTRDTFIDLDWRPEFADRKKADLFVSLHFNSAESSRSSVQGSEVYCLTPAGADSTNTRSTRGGGDRCAGNRNDAQNITLAYLVQRSLTRRLGVEDRGVRRARFAVLRDAVMPAVLVEAGFMSHPGEGRKIFSSEYRRQIAAAICEAMIDYKRLAEKGN